MKQEKIDDNLIKKKIYDLLSSKETRLAELFKKHEQDIHYYNDSKSEGCGKYCHCNGKIFINLNLPDKRKIKNFSLANSVMKTFHEIGHKLDTKSRYYFQSELRARKFEYNVAKRLGGSFLEFSSSDFMTLAAAKGDYNTFGQLFNLHTFYRKQVGMPCSNYHKLFNAKNAN